MGKIIVTCLDLKFGKRAMLVMRIKYSLDILSERVLTQKYNLSLFYIYIRLTDLCERKGLPKAKSHESPSFILYRFLTRDRFEKPGRLDRGCRSHSG